MKPPKQKSYYIEARIGLSTSLQVSAKSLEEALAKAKEMKVSDFIEIVGDHNDSNLEISGIFNCAGAPELS